MWQEQDRLKCPGCGLSSTETMAPEAEGEYSAHKLKCHACAVRDAKAADHEGPAHGLLFSVSKGG